MRQANINETVFLFKEMFLMTSVTIDQQYLLSLSYIYHTLHIYLHVGADFEHFRLHVPRIIDQDDTSSAI